jgi:succinate dehydrogenase/fumarate reductase-like Fe-S protein
MATLRIHRFVEGRKWVQDYKVEVTKGMTVLEALISIKEHQDPSLYVLLPLEHLRRLRRARQRQR